MTTGCLAARSDTAALPMAEFMPGDPARPRPHSGIRLEQSPSQTEGIWAEFLKAHSIACESSSNHRIAAILMRQWFPGPFGPDIVTSAALPGHNAPRSLRGQSGGG